MISNNWYHAALRDLFRAHVRGIHEAEVARVLERPAGPGG